jgi:REP element-mobilizing transposase RayT
MQIFTDDTDYRRFVYFLGDTVEACSLECLNYCLMPNHYHVTLLPTGCNLSESIRRLNSLYAQWWNRRHGRVGHVFQGRFKDQTVDRESYLLALSRYVVTNPVRAQLVRAPHEWPWSSYSATVGSASCPAFLNLTPTLALFGEGDTSALQVRFRDYVHDSVDERITDRIRSNERVLGSRTFKLSLRPAVEEAATA